MPTIPGPPEHLSDAERMAWLKGAATVAKLQSDQWAILADQYERAVADVDGESEFDLAAAARDDAEQDTTDGDGGDDDGGPEPCPECGAERIDSFDGPICPNCD